MLVLALLGIAIHEEVVSTAKKEKENIQSEDYKLCCPDVESQRRYIFYSGSKCKKRYKLLEELEWRNVRIKNVLWKFSNHT